MSRDEAPTYTERPSAGTPGQAPLAQPPAPVNQRDLFFSWLSSFVTFAFVSRRVGCGLAGQDNSSRAKQRRRQRGFSEFHVDLR